MFQTIILVIYVRFRKCKMENSNVEEKFHLFCLGFCSTKTWEATTWGEKNKSGVYYLVLQTWETTA